MKDIKVGDTVIIKTYNITGKVIEKIDDDRYRIERKFQSIIVNKEDLTVVKEQSKYKNLKIRDLYDPFDYIYEIDFHGATKLEALKEVTFLIENASFHQYPIIKITHGKGKGILRQAIHELLKEYKEKGLITSYEFAQDNKGGYGVTIVYLSNNNNAS